MKDNSIYKKNSDVELRPRFQLQLPYTKEAVLNAFENTTNKQSNLIVSRADDHVFIKFPKNDQTFWSPQLHLEVNDTNESHAIIYGLYGPNPTLWLFFMFLHLVLGVVAIGFGIWLYSNWSLGNSFFMQAIVLGVIICIWILLYVFGRLGRASVKEEMYKLQDFKYQVLNTL